jgi:predicted TIM-barrel fold metal-dependent hydrolase
MPFVTDAHFATSSGTTAELEAAGCRMYNRWLADFVSTQPDRHAALAYVPWSELDAAVREIEWARSAGLRGVNFPAPNAKRPYYADARYERVWAAAADLDMPLATHTGGGDRWDYDDGVLGQAFQKVELGFVARRGIWQLMMSGVFERHPNLKLVMTEIYAAWINEMLRDLDFAYVDTINPPIRQRLPKMPSEYWLTNCFVGASFMSHDEALMYPDRGAVNMMWGSDYPHLEGTHPYTRLSLKKTFAGIPAEYVRPMVGLTAAKVFGLDVAKLQQVADKIGPTVDDLASAPTTRPDESYVGYGFRENTNWPARAYRAKLEVR